MRQETAEQRGPLARPVRQNLRNKASVVIVENRQRDTAKESKNDETNCSDIFASQKRDFRAQQGIHRQRWILTQVA
ncbi:hypothetical protein DT23_05390 [Thioclava indica]|uniref:Uncharacterized protein n=1 Tax=Thioclava indica TaxID=1353528 RepID=A0A074JLZ0_9RHOB|nr:hypothetical protein DT23_05390 [Thioclava indica]